MKLIVRWLVRQTYDYSPIPVPIQYTVTLSPPLPSESQFCPSPPLPSHLLNILLPPMTTLAPGLHHSPPFPTHMHPPPHPLPLQTVAPSSLPLLSHPSRYFSNIITLTATRSLLPFSTLPHPLIHSLSHSTPPNKCDGLVESVNAC